MYGFFLYNINSKPKTRTIHIPAWKKTSPRFSLAFRSLTIGASFWSLFSLVWQPLITAFSIVDGDDETGRHCPRLSLIDGSGEFEDVNSSFFPSKYHAKRHYVWPYDTTLDKQPHLGGGGVVREGVWGAATRHFNRVHDVRIACRELAWSRH